MKKLTLFSCGWHFFNFTRFPTIMFIVFVLWSGHPSSRSTELLSLKQQLLYRVTDLFYNKHSNDSFSPFHSKVKLVHVNTGCKAQGGGGGLDIIIRQQILLLYVYIIPMFSICIASNISRTDIRLMLRPVFTLPFLL